jgi:hydrogenase/urease accessory protein HupE
MINPAKRFSLFFCTVLLLLTAVPVHSHNLPLGGSKWCAGKNGIVATIDLNEGLFSDIRGIKESHYDYASGAYNQLQQLAQEFIQPYVNKYVHVSVNGKDYPVKVDKLVRHENSLYTIWLSVDKAGFNKPENVLKIDYKMLFEETNNTHVNLAYFYKSDATGDALQKFFDNYPAEGEYNFTSNTPAWELSVRGAATVSAAAPVISAVQPSFIAQIDRDTKKTATQRMVSASPAPDSRPVTPDKGDAIHQASASQNSVAVISEPSQNKQNTDNTGAAASNAPTGKNAVEGAKNGSVPSTWSTIGTFILLGIEHILTGYDHIAFLIGLIVIGLSIREVLKIITAFTIAHSITLLLAALQVISLNSRFVESVIAVSICYIALENLFKKEVKYRWLITFCFGLIHGFGFASALQELIVGKTNLILSVVSFNFGVETGQLMIFFILLPVLHLLKQKMEFRKVTVGVSLVIFVLGFTWLIERLFDLKLLPI